MRGAGLVLGLILVCLGTLLGGCATGGADGSKGVYTPAEVAASAQCGDQPIQMKVQPLSPYVYQQGDGYAYFDVWLEACPVPGGPGRQPMDISLVVDSSGSMGGQKIANARNAALYLLGQLGPRDRLALITYNTNVTILFPLSPVTADNRAWMSQRIAGLWANGMTNLGGGLDIGVRQLGNAQERQSVSKVILISDGLANVGVTSPAALNGMASIARQSGVSVTTMGVGLQFNELLLQSLAEYGGGRYHYLRNAHALLPIFRQEIQGAQATVATNVNLRVAACDGCEVVEAPGYALKRRGRMASIVVANFAGGQKMKAMVKVRLPRARAAKRVLAVRLSYDAVRLHRRGLNRDARVAFRVTPDRAKVVATMNKRVAGRLLHVQASQATQKAMHHYSFGSAAVAGNLLDGAAERLERHHRSTGSKRSLRRARALRSAAREIRARPVRSSRGQHLQKQLRYKAYDAFAE